MPSALPYPDRNRLSALAALVLLAIALVRIVSLPELEAQVRAFGIVVELKLSADLVLVGLASAVTVTGADGLVRSHPLLAGAPRRYDHLVLPGLATLSAGVVLTGIGEGAGLWLGLTAAAALLLAILVAEFVAVDPEDPRAEAAALGLRALGVAFLAISLVGILGTNTRAVFAVPSAFIAGSAVAWRTLRLETRPVRAVLYALLVGAVIAELAWALHYWPVEPLQAAVILAAAGYSILGTVEAHAAGKLSPLRAAEYAVLALAGILAASVFM